MQVIKPSAVIMEHNVTPYEFIEKVGRTCYKSENMIKEGSAEVFVGNLINREHWAMLEHETLYLSLPESLMKGFILDMRRENESLAFFNITSKHFVHIISGSFRSFHDLFAKGYNCESVNTIKRIMQMNYPLVFPVDEIALPYYKDCDYCLMTREEFLRNFRYDREILHKHLTHTVLFTCDRGVSHELVRHRPCSFAQESTRYCNYSKDKFGKEIVVIEPFFFRGVEKHSAYIKWYSACEKAEKEYMELLDWGATPQEARGVLPNSLKTELIMTATEAEWQHIINLRYLGTTGAPHPQAKEVMSCVVDDLISASEGRLHK